MSLNTPEHFNTPARPTVARREVLVPQKRTLNGTRGNETESTLMLSHNDHHIRNIPRGSSKIDKIYDVNR